MHNIIPGEHSLDAFSNGCDQVQRECKMFPMQLRTPSFVDFVREFARRHERSLLPRVQNRPCFPLVVDATVFEPEKRAQRQSDPSDMKVPGKSV
jgi:hypothetical protein